MHQYILHNIIALNLKIGVISIFEINSLCLLCITIQSESLLKITMCGGKQKKLELSLVLYQSSVKLKRVPTRHVS